MLKTLKEIDFYQFSCDKNFFLTKKNTSKGNKRICYQKLCLINKLAIKFYQLESDEFEIFSEKYVVIVKMSFKQVVVLLLWRFLLIQSSLINDEICENQLKYFDHALMNREHWALYGKWVRMVGSSF